MAKKQCYFNRSHSGPLYGMLLMGVGNINACRDCKDDWNQEGQKPSPKPKAVQGCFSKGIRR